MGQLLRGHPGPEGDGPLVVGAAGAGALPDGGAGPRGPRLAAARRPAVLLCALQLRPAAARERDGAGRAGRRPQDLGRHVLQAGVRGGDVQPGGGPGLLWGHGQEPAELHDVLCGPPGRPVRLARHQITTASDGVAAG